MIVTCVVTYAFSVEVTVTCVVKFDFSVEEIPICVAMMHVFFELVAI